MENKNELTNNEKTKCIKTRRTICYYCQYWQTKKKDIR